MYDMYNYLIIKTFILELRHVIKISLPELSLIIFWLPTMSDRERLCRAMPGVDNVSPKNILN